MGKVLIIQHRSLFCFVQRRKYCHHFGTPLPFRLNLFNILVSKPYFVLADAYYIPLVCYLSRKSVQLNIVLTVCLFVYIRTATTSVVDTAVSILITVLDPKGNVQGYPIYIKSHMPWHLICSFLMILPPGSASLQNNDKIKCNPLWGRKRT